MKVEFLILSVYFAVIHLSDEVYTPRRTACPLLKLKNGRVRIMARTFAKFSCNKGYLLAGERYSKCTQGVWDSPAPLCVRPNCKKIQQIKNGAIHPSHRGAVLNFYCGTDFVLEGASRAYCIDAKWNNNMPSCLPTNITPSMSCDFEREDICGWTHDLNHNFDWTRLNTKTPSGHLSTGPSEDHTKGLGGNGYYMFIEGSTKNVNDTAKFISPMYKRESNNTCLEFYYHMYGSGIGQLRVYVKKINESWDLNLDDAIFWKEGNHGNEWLRGFVELGPINDQFQVIFEGIRGNSYISDIAIDDVKIIENCITEPMTTTEQEPEGTTFLYDSCNDKCNMTGLMDMSCSCDENCYDNKTCCPDYIAICVLGNDLETTDFDMAVTTGMNIDITTMAATELPTIQTQKIQTYTTQFTLPPTTEEKHLPATTEFFKITTVSTLKPTRKPFTTNAPIIPDIVITTQQQKDMQTTSSTIMQQQKEITTSTPTIKIRDTTLPTIPTQTPKSKETTATKYFYNDMLTVPISMTTEDTYIVDMTEENKEPYTKEYPLDDRDSDPVLSDKVYPVHERPTPSNKITVIAVLTMCFIVVGVLGLIFLAKRYTSRSCVRRMRSGNGDSQSDVRFLTSDEILDFRVAKF